MSQSSEDEASASGVTAGGQQVRAEEPDPAPDREGPAVSGQILDRVLVLEEPEWTGAKPPWCQRSRRTGPDWTGTTYWFL
ncbi:hypothetical protein EYF80_002550 [Liparis tanakae]|uniref:Uncharacterized protein n=1 Tax=Liparis tanakae TaxID=230148 RepID=A0A4Z2JAV2_9TELE|nr:hypothetical protein EYF80_002550 [Liparis tanakae]